MLSGVSSACFYKLLIVFITSKITSHLLSHLSADFSGGSFPEISTCLLEYTRQIPISEQISLHGQYTMLAVKLPLSLSELLSLTYCRFIPAAVECQGNLFFRVHKANSHFRTDLSAW